MRDRWSWPIMAVLMAGAILIAYALLTFSTHSGMGPGNDVTRVSYGSLNIVLAILGSGMATGSAVFLLMRRMPVSTVSPPLMSPSPAPSGQGAPLTGPAVEDSRFLADPYLILRLLGGDEQEVFRSIVEAGGEQLQRDIVELTKLSDAKVSRVLDRLEAKGMVARERRDMGNVVRIALDKSN
ncbi:MAG: hypothetical protein GX307_05875 [Euryarchaeota archaeon]|nr:hypothetical protein [Euryarchaeota archaeon]